MIARQKSRYVRIGASEILDFSDRGLLNAFLDALRIEMGGIGYVKANPKIVNCGNSGIVIRVNRGFEDSLVLAVAFVKNVAGKRLGFYTFGVSGSVKNLKEKQVKLPEHAL